MIVSLQATQCDSAVEDEQSDGVIYDSKFFRSHFGNLTVYAYATRLPCVRIFHPSPVTLVGFPFVRRAIVPESISSYLLPQLLGQAAAFALLLSGKLFSPTHPPLEPALEFAKELGVTTSAVSIASTKALLNHPTATPEEGHPAESYLLKKTTRGEGTDSIEGAKAFKEGRAPEFKDTVGVMKHWAPWWKNLDVSVGTPKL